MSRPPAKLLEARLPCGPGVSDVVAMRACLEAAAAVGLSVGGQTRSSVVLLPRSVPQSLLRCLSAGAAALSPSAAAPLPPPPDVGAVGAGCGVAAELTCRGGDSLAISVVSPEAEKGAEYIAALRERLAIAAPQAAAQGEADGVPSPMLRESSAYLLVSKMLCDRREPPGTFATDFVQRFTERYGEAAAADGGGGEKRARADAERPLAECVAAVERLRAMVEQAVADLGMRSPVLPEEVGPLLRKQVERFLFARVGPLLWRHYSSRCKDADDRYSVKFRALGRVADFDLLEALEVRPVFCGSGAAAGSGSPSSPAPRRPFAAFGGDDDDDLDDEGAEGRCSAAAGGGETGGTGEEPPPARREAAVAHFYDRAAAALQQVEASIQRGGTPASALEALMSAQVELKACAFEASCGLAELASMDDILPLFVFVLLRSRVRRPLALAALLRDGLSAEQRIDAEGRAVQLLESAAGYVADDWELAEVFALGGVGAGGAKGPSSA